MLGFSLVIPVFQKVRGDSDNLSGFIHHGSGYIATFGEYSNVTVGTNLSYGMVNLNRLKYTLSLMMIKNGQLQYNNGKLKLGNYDIAVRHKMSRQFDNGVEINYTLYFKPIVNKITFPIKYSKGLSFYYQPPLNKELDISKYDFVNETTAIKDGRIMVYRPPNVVGSYAVYCNKSGDFSKLGGLNYATGKLYHIYRPMVIDSSGKTAWCNLSIDKNKLVVSIPQDFLDNAIYPVVVDPTFGYTTAGSSWTTLNSQIVGSNFTLIENGTAVSITGYFNNTNTVNSENIEMAVYNSTTLIGIAATEEGHIASNTVTWNTENMLTSDVNLTDVNYLLMAIGEAEVYLAYDGGSTNQSCVGITDGYPDLPGDLHDKGYSNDNNKYSIYLNYTTSGGGASWQTITSGYFDFQNQSTNKNTNSGWFELQNQTGYKDITSGWFTFSNPSGNSAPTISNENPANGSTGISLQPTCNVTVTDADGNLMNVTFASNYSGAGGSGSEVLDYEQSTLGTATSLGSNYWGQAFTTSHAGTLTNVSIYLYRYSSTTDNMSLYLWNVSNGLPNTMISYLGDIDYNDVGQSYAWHTLTVANPPTLTNNTEYAIIWHSPGSYASYPLALTTTAGNIVYSTDNSTWKNGKDWSLKTYIDNALDTSKSFGTAAVWSSTSDWKAIPFTAGSSGSLTNVSIIAYLYSNSEANITFHLYSSDSDGKVGSLIQDLGTIYYTDMDSSYSWRQLNITNSPSVTSGVKYYIVMNKSSGGNVAIKWGFNTVDSAESSDSGSTWKYHDNPVKVYITEGGNEWVNYQTNSSVTNGSYSWIFTGANNYSTEYWWKVYVDDGTDNISKTYHFTTASSSASWHTLTSGYFTFMNSSNYKNIESGYFTFANSSSYKNVESGWFIFSNSSTYKTIDSGWFDFSNVTEYKSIESGYFTFENTTSYKTITSGWFKFNSQVEFTTISSGYFDFSNQATQNTLTSGYVVFGNQSSWVTISSGWFTFENSSYTQSLTSGYFEFGNQTSTKTIESGYCTFGNISSSKNIEAGYFISSNVSTYKDIESGWFDFTAQERNFHTLTSGWFTFNNQTGYKNIESGYFIFENSLNYNNISYGYFTFSNTTGYKNIGSGWFEFSNLSIYKTVDSGYFTFTASGEYKDIESGWFKFANLSEYKSIDSGWFKFTNSSGYKNVESGFFIFSNVSNYNNISYGYFNFANASSYKTVTSGWFTFIVQSENYSTLTSGWFKFDNISSQKTLKQGYFDFSNISSYKSIASGYFGFANYSTNHNITSGYLIFANSPANKNTSYGWFNFVNISSYKTITEGYINFNNVSSYNNVSGGWFTITFHVNHLPLPPENVLPYNRSRNVDPTSYIILQAFIPEDPDGDSVVVTVKDDTFNVTLYNKSITGGQTIEVKLIPWYLNWSESLNWSIHLYDGYGYTNTSYWFKISEKPTSILITLDRSGKELIVLIINLIIWLFFIGLSFKAKYVGEVEQMLFGLAVLGSGLVAALSPLLISFSILTGLISSIIFGLSLYIALKNSLFMFWRNRK